MARAHARTDRGKTPRGIRALGQLDWQNRQRRLRDWIAQHQAVAVYKAPNGVWTLLQVEGYLDAGILSAFRFSEQRTIAESVLRL